MKLWIDDVRPAPENGCAWCKSTNGAYDFITSREEFHRDDPLLIDLDHDAGEWSSNGGDYIEILKILEQLYWMHKEWKDYIDKQVTFHIHSMNTVGVENMRRIIQKNGWKEI